MSERKYNTNNNMNENGEKVRSVESNTRPVWRRYAAIAATFVLLAGGIGGTIALGKHVNNNKRSDNKLAAAAVEITTTAPETTTAAMTTTVTSTTTQVVTDATIAEIVTSAAETTAEVAFDVTETTTVTADERRNPSDLAAFAEEWKDKYEEYIWKVNCGAVEHEENTVSFQVPDETGDGIYQFDAWKVTDKKFSSADAIYEFVRSVWAPGTKDDFVIPDITDKIDSGKGSATDFQNLFFIYKNELYVVSKVTGMEGERKNPSAEKLNDNEMLVHWTLGYEGVDVKQTLHLVWVDEYNDWRIDSLPSDN